MTFTYTMIFISAIVLFLYLFHQLVLVKNGTTLSDYTFITIIIVLLIAIIAGFLYVSYFSINLMFIGLGYLIGNSIIYLGGLNIIIGLTIPVLVGLLIYYHQRKLRK